MPHSVELPMGQARASLCSPMPPHLKEACVESGVATAISLNQPMPEPASSVSPYDEMRTMEGLVRPHYAALEGRIATLSPAQLAERQRALERFFLLQGITFTVYGAESTTERIIPTDLLPRIIPADEWAKIEAGLIQRLQALNMFLADIYGEQQILMDGVMPRELVLCAPSYRREMQNLFVPHNAYANVCGSDLI